MREKSKAPNQSGIRFVPLLFSLLLISRWIDDIYTKSFYWKSGLIVGCLFWLSLEMGLTLTAALIATIFLVSYSENRNLLKSLFEIFNFLFPLFITISILILGVTPKIVTNTSSLSEFILLFGVSGYGGLKSDLSFTASIMIGFSLFIVFSICLKVRRFEKINSNEIWQFLISIIILVWHYYYFNRMAEWNLWFNWLLLVLLASSYFTYSTPKEILGNTLNTIFLNNKKPLSFRIALLMLAIAFFGQTVSSSRTSLVQLKSHIDNQLNRSCVYQYRNAGFCFDNNTAVTIRNYLDDLRKFDFRYTIILSEVSTITRLEGFNKGLSFYSAFDAVTVSDIERMKRNIERHPAYLMIWPDREGTLSIARGTAFKEQVNFILGNDSMNIQPIGRSFEGVDLK